MGTSQGKPLCWELKLPPASELLQAVSEFGVFLPHLTEVARWLSQPREEGPSLSFVRTSATISPVGTQRNHFGSRASPP